MKVLGGDRGLAWRPALIRAWALVLVGLAAGGASAQDDPPAWILDRPPLGRAEAPLWKDPRPDDAQFWREVWDRADRSGPMLGVRLDEALGASNRHELQLCLVGALGLAGGPTARAELLDRAGKGKACDRALAFLALARPRVRVTAEELLRAVERGDQSQVVRLAASLAVLAAELQLDDPSVLLKGRDPALKQLQPLVNALAAARNPDLRLDKLDLPFLAKTAPVPGSLADFEERALLLLAAARPGVLNPDSLRTYLGRATTERSLPLASLALGRVAQEPSLPDLPNLNVPWFLLGLGRLDADLERVLLDGPGAARSKQWQEWHYAVAARLLPKEALPALADRLLEAGPEVAGLGIRALCHRLLLREEPIPARLARFVQGEPDPRLPPEALLLGFLAEPSREPDARQRGLLGPFRCYCLETWRAGRFGTDGAGRILWARLSELERLVPLQGPGSLEHALLDELNDLGWNLFLIGSELVERTNPSLVQVERFLPEGLRRMQESFFRVTDAYLRAWPLFRRWPRL